MSINFSTNSKEIQDAYQKVLNPDDKIDWALFTPTVGNDLKVSEIGDGGIEELVLEFEGGKIQFGFARVLEPNSKLPRFVLISWCGDGVPIFKKGRFNQDINDVAAYFNGFHVHINARNEEDIDPALIMKKISASSGAKYSIQQTALITNQPILQPKTFIPPPATSVVPKPHLAAKEANIVSAPSKVEDLQSLHGTVNSTYVPVQTNPKPLKHEYQKNQPHEIVNSSYIPIQTNPKPLKNIFESKIPTSADNIKGKLNDQDEPIRSSYEPVKTTPKPLVNKFEVNKSNVASIQSINAHQMEDRDRIEKELVGQREAAEVQRKNAEKLQKEEEERIKAQKEAEQRAYALQLEQENAKRLEQERRLEEERSKSQNLASAPDSISAIALYDYDPGNLFFDAVESNEIPLIEGETISNIVILDDGWWQGSNSSGQVGLFPANYVEIIENHQNDFTNAATKVPEEHTDNFGKNAEALYDYEAGEENEISFSAGDQITNIEFVSDDWWSGKLRGRVGLCKSLS